MSISSKYLFFFQSLFFLSFFFDFLCLSSSLFAYTYHSSAFSRSVFLFFFGTFSESHSKSFHCLLSLYICYIDSKDSSYCTIIKYSARGCIIHTISHSFFCINQEYFPTYTEVLGNNSALDVGSAFREVGDSEYIKLNLAFLSL